jgi:hypothetical protein
MFKEMFWNPGAKIGIIIMIAGMILLCVSQIVPSHADMEADVRKITNSLIACNDTELPMDYIVEYSEYSKYFHNPFCAFVSREELEECEKSKALSQGLLPCKTCKP